jgi:aryl-alcohol dehydrogenase-like predicted oxidoreductase
MSLPVEDVRLCKGIVHAALDAGVNLIDTADLYDKGRNEEVLGMALQGRRDSVILATKVGNRWRSDGSTWDWDPSPAYIEKALEDSLRRLKTDRIDVYQLHGGTMEDPVDEVIGLFERFKAAGKILHYGISSIRPSVIRTWVERSSLTSVMTQYSLGDRRPEEQVLPLLQKNGIGVLARGVLARGFLCGKPPDAYAGQEAVSMAAAAQALAACSGSARPVVHSAIRFALHSDAVTTAVVGAATIAQIAEAASVFSTSALTETEFSELAGILPPLLYREHR